MCFNLKSLQLKDKLGYFDHNSTHEQMSLKRLSRSHIATNNWSQQTFVYPEGSHVTTCSDNNKNITN